MTDSTAQAPHGGQPRNAGYVTLGTIITSAPHAALLLALRRLRPQCIVRMREHGNTPQGETQYRIELRNEANAAAETGLIDAWLRIKSALMAAFPADRPHAVRAIDP